MIKHIHYLITSGRQDVLLLIPKNAKNLAIRQLAQLLLLAGTEFTVLKKKIHAVNIGPIRKKKKMK